MDTRNYNLLDKLLLQINDGLDTLFATQNARHKNPSYEKPDTEFSDQENQQISGMMRVNHAGEVCAQALYRGQSVLARSDEIRKILLQAAEEETDHLAWTNERILELGSHRSYLNVLWYINSYFIGMLVALFGDQYSLGFVEETEKQVSQHLQNHLNKLPAEDHKSRAIITKMQQDEERHGKAAQKAGAKELPSFIKNLMTLHARVMTTIAYWI